MFQEPATPSVDIATGFAMGIGHAVGSALALFLSVLIVAPALASLTLLWAGQRWPSLGASVVGNGAGGVVLTILIAWLVLSVMGFLNTMIDFSGVYRLMPLAGLGVMAVMLFVQWRARATFSRARLAGILCALLTPVAWILTYNVWG